MPAANTQFAIAVHLIAALAYRQGSQTCSEELAGSVNTNASFVRRILSKLAKASLVSTAPGKGRNSILAKDPQKITLAEIYRAVDPAPAFSIHPYLPAEGCFVSNHIKPSLGHVLEKAQGALEMSLGEVFLSDVMEDMRR